MFEIDNGLMSFFITIYVAANLFEKNTFVVCISSYDTRNIFRYLQSKISAFENYINNRMIKNSGSVNFLMTFCDCIHGIYDIDVMLSFLVSYNHSSIK